MIQNELQRAITLEWAEKFERTLAELRDAPDTRLNIHPILRKAELDALASQARDLREELAAYDALRPGDSSTIRVASFDDLPSALIQARIARGLTQRELALRLDLKEQQIQHYEATRYASASLTRVGAVIHALGIEASLEIHLPRDAETTPASA
jgi:ribosome-binding protein aMBF1 (putative translation factor)